jgi:hypothetical protein
MGGADSRIGAGITRGTGRDADIQGWSVVVAHTNQQSLTPG